MSIEEIDEEESSSHESNENIVVTSLEEENDDWIGFEESTESRFYDEMLANLGQRSFSRFSEFADKLNRLRINHNISSKAVKEINSIYMDLIENPPKESAFIEGVTRFSNSKFLMDKFITRKENYTKSIQYVKGDISFSYVSIKDIIPILINEDILSSIMSEDQNNVSRYVNSLNLQKTIRIILYADDFGMVNPIGFARGRHKIFSVYMDIDCPMKLRQKSRDIPCVVLAERKQGLKSEKLSVVLKPLVDELKFLSEYGIFLEEFNINVPVKLAFIIGDNLAVAELLGFRQTFGKNFICRYCNSTYAQIKDKDQIEGQLNYMLPENVVHEELAKIKGNKNYKSQYGIKFESPFLSVPINIFQISPPDIFHDFVEGPLGDIIKIIIKKTKVGRENLKRKMAIKYVNDKISFGKKEQIMGKAAQKFEFFCRLIEIFPEWLTDPPEIFYFYDLVRRMIGLMFSKPTESGLKELRKLIKSFQKDIKKYDLIKPKTHFISHYPSLMEFYGCLTAFSTMAWERKHRMLKVLMQHSKNFKNVAKTLMILHQAKLSYESISTPNEWPLNKNIVRLINDEKSSTFILAHSFIKIGNKLLVEGEKITTIPTELPYLKKTISIEKSVRYDTNQISHINCFTFLDKKFVNFIQS
ncbi:hypothetical protein HUG17_5990 [Dermatophagoides farinae]|uniref:Uncharacterized protein n=1 Tax=Dermatophagoides farinae TaxID=6954 RepID=A0A9D4SJ72_DERFA|nr:hypothetical protein HUG17_5990 [Dermatophagoides farinae]